MKSANVFFRFLKKRERVGWRRLLHRVLTAVGPTWRSSPWRRGVQAACLGMFLWAFFHVCWPYADVFTATTFGDKETFDVELFLLIDPLVGVSTVLAGKFFNPTLWWTAGIVLLCVLVPRAFCGWLCPLGTLIDLFDWAIGGRIKRFHLDANSRPIGWVHAKYYLLTTILVTSALGVLTAGFLSAIPVLTRGLLLTGGRAQIALVKGERHLLPVDGAWWLSLVLFAGVFLVSLLGKRFWCRYLCPSGALLSVLNRLRVGERKVESTCINCNKCIEICPFDAIHQDFTTRTDDCTYCQSCGGVCPTDAIKFVTRWNAVELKVLNEPEVVPRPVSRRGFLCAASAGAAVTVLARSSVAGRGVGIELPVRPPGSVPEEDFLRLCIRCGECFKVCPGPVLHPAGFEHGLDALWTPVAQLSHAGCHQECMACTQVCPTGAIQPLSLDVKRAVHMGLAKVDSQTCLPMRDDEHRAACDLCYRECVEAGYDAIRMQPVRRSIDDLPPEERPPEGLFSDVELDEMLTSHVPIVDADKCVGCGICEARCHTRYVRQEAILGESAIRVVAENEDRRRFGD